MKTIILIISFMFLVAGSFAHGNQKIDSLHSLLTNDNSSENIEILLQLSKLYRNENIDIAMKYAKEALNKAEYINDANSIAYSNMKLGICYAIKGEYVIAEESFLKAKQLFEETQDYDGLGKAYISLGRINNFQGKNKNSILNYYDAINCFEKTGYKTGLCDAYNNIGVAFEHLGDNMKALEYYHKALPIAESQRDNGAISEIYNNIGIIYFKENKNEKALAYYNKALDLIKNKSNNNQKSILLNNIAQIHFENKQYEKSLEVQRESLEIENKISKDYAIPLSLSNIGNMYIAMGNNKLAKAYLDSARHLAKKIDDKVSIAYCDYYYAVLLDKNKQFDKAINSLLKSIQLSEEYAIEEDLINKYELLTNIYSKQGNHKKAFQWQSRLMQLKDSLNRINKDRSIEAISANYEIQNRVRVLEKENLMYEARNEKLTLIIIGLMLLMSSFLTSVLIVRKHKARINKQEKKILQQHFFQEKIYSLMTNELRSTLFSLSYEILKLKGTDHFKNLNDTYMEFSKEYDRIINAYKTNALNNKVTEIGKD